MARPSDILNLFKIIQFTLLIVTVVLPNKLINFFLVTGTNKFPYNFFGNVAADVFVVIALVPHLLLFKFYENM